MTYVVPRKGTCYRISGLLIAENNGAFIYPADVYTKTYIGETNSIVLNNSPFFILDVDCTINDSDKGAEYIRGVIQGYNGTCYLSSYNTGCLKSF